MKTVFGIHIGNTNSSIAVCKSNGQSEMIVDEAGDRVVPSLITITEEESILGNAAKAGLPSNWKRTVSLNKILMNTDTKNFNSRYHKDITVEIKNGEIHYVINVSINPITNCMETRHLTPENITEIMLRKLYITAKNSMNLEDKIISCVLLVPENFSEDACKKYKTAAESAGWNVLQMINEMAAAVLCYSLLDHKQTSQTIMVYRLGGTTCEVGCYDLSDGMLYTMGTEFNNNLGGNHFYKILSEYLADQFFLKFKLDVRENQRSQKKLQLEAEKCVQTLSKGQTAHCFVESLQDGVDFSITISRSKFEQLIQPSLFKYLEPIKLLLDEMHLDNSVDQVILCGGAINIIKLKASISSLFDTTVTQILSHINADEVLPLGAAKQGYYLAHNNVRELLPRTLQIPVVNDYVNNNIE